MRIQIIADRTTHLLMGFSTIFIAIIYIMAEGDKFALIFGFCALVCFLFMYINKQKYCWEFSQKLQNYFRLGVFIFLTLFLFRMQSLLETMMEAKLLR